MQKKMNAAVQLLKAVLDHVPYVAALDPFDVGYVSIEKTDYNRRFPVFSLIYLLILIYFYDVQHCCYYVDYYGDYLVGSFLLLLLLSCQMSCASCTREMSDDAFCPVLLSGQYYVKPLLFYCIKVILCNELKDFCCLNEEQLRESNAT